MTLNLQNFNNFKINFNFKNTMILANYKETNNIDKFLGLMLNLTNNKINKTIKNI